MDKHALVIQVAGDIDQRDYHTAGEYSLNRLEGIIGATYDETTRRAYIANWFDRAQSIASSPRADAAEWMNKVRHRKITWSTYLTAP